MTVKQLREALKGMPEDQLVLVKTDDGGPYPFHPVILAGSTGLGCSGTPGARRARYFSLHNTDLDPGETRIGACVLFL